MNTITLTPTQVKLLEEMIENHFELWKHFSNVSREDALALQSLSRQIEAAKSKHVA